jgi:hypothetical protein
MKRLLVALTLALTLGLGVMPAFASCTGYTYMDGGRRVYCSECCFGQSCLTRCTY